MPIVCRALDFFAVNTKRINAWSSPRNISTALMYAFAQREDTTVVDEPLYAHYLSQEVTQAAHPGRPEILKSQHKEGTKVASEVLLGDYSTPVVFFKQMTHHLVNIEDSFLAQMDNILLIRDPRAIIASYSKVIPNPTIQDIGVEQQYLLYRQLRSVGAFRAVLDARQLLLDPPGVLQQLCECLDIAYDSQMLSWPKGARPEDGVWAKYWYSSVHQSEGFKPYKERVYELPPALESLAERCQPYYDALFDVALKAHK